MGNLFKDAAAYRRKHPNVSQQEAVQIVSKKKKPASKKSAGAKRKKATVAGTKKSAKKVTVRARKVTMNIGAVSMGRLGSELTHLQKLEQKLAGDRDALKLTKDRGAKAAIRRDIARTRAAITNSKKHITALKRTI